MGRLMKDTEGIAPGTAADNGPQESMGEGVGEGPTGVPEQAEGGLETAGRPNSRGGPKGWGEACKSVRAADGGPRGGVRIGFRPHLKSLSLDVIFSSKLEMWYEALAMLTASIPPASALGAAARGRRCWAPPLGGGGSRFQGRSATPTETRGAATSCPLPGETWACPRGSGVAGPA